MDKNLFLKAKDAKSVEELMALAKENGIELNEEDAKKYFEQLSAKKGELSDDELSNVSGGGCETTVDGKKYTVVTNLCDCFTGQYLNNWVYNHGEYEMVHRKDNSGLREFWFDSLCWTSHYKQCGSCAHLGFKDGIGYCEKS